MDYEAERLYQLQLRNRTERLIANNDEAKLLIDTYRQTLERLLANEEKKEQEQ